MRSSIRRSLLAVCASWTLFVLASQPALAQSSGGALADVFESGLKGFVRFLFNPVKGIGNFTNILAEFIVGTPHPDAVFTKPSNSPWSTVYEYYWRNIIPASLSLYGVAIGLVIFFESTSHVFSSYHRSKLKSRAFTGLLGILSWWWVAALSLRFIDALTGFLTPNLNNPSWFQVLSFGNIGLIGLVVSWSADLILFLLIGLVYVVRHYMLYLYVLLMPVLMVLWIPGVGPFALVSRFMKKLASFYTPFLFMPVPVAMLFRLGDILGTSVQPSIKGIGTWLLAIVIPFLALIIPFILIWQASAIFFIGGRIGHHLSVKRAKNRAVQVKEGAATGKQGGRNFVRGLRSDPAIKRDGQYVLDSGNSRAHAAGKRLSTAGSRLREKLSRGDGGNGDNGGGGGGPDPSDDGGGNGDDSDPGYDRSNDDGLRDPQPRQEQRETADDPPRYIN